MFIISNPQHFRLADHLAGTLTVRRTVHVVFGAIAAVFMAVDRGQCLRRTERCKYPAPACPKCGCNQTLYLRAPACSTLRDRRPKIRFDRPFVYAVAFGDIPQMAFNLRSSEISRRSSTAIRSRQNWTRSPIVITRGPPMVPVTEPKLAPLFGQPLEMVALVQDSVPTGRVVGIVVDLPEPL